MYSGRIRTQIKCFKSSNIYRQWTASMMGKPIVLRGVFVTYINNVVTSYEAKTRLKVKLHLP